MARLVMFSVLVSTLATASPRLLPRQSLLALATGDVELVETTKAPEPHVPTLLATGAFAGLIATPLSHLAGAGFGKLSNNLYAALVPALLTALLVPPLAVVLTEWMVAERTGKGRFRLIPSLLAGIVAQAGILAAGIFLDVNATNGTGVAIMTLASTVVLPTVTTAMLKLTERPPVVSVPVLSGNF